jgi:alkylated DNA nucleotide flippase Atl1
VKDRIIMAKRAIDKLNEDKQPHIVQPIPQGFPGWNSAPDASMVVSTPREVKDIIERIPEGQLLTLDNIRRYLAFRHKTTIACPVSTAIFINVAAKAAEEMRAMGEAEITPYWRVLKPGGVLNPKYPGGVDAQRMKLEAEGFHVIQGKGGLRVKDFEEFLFSLTTDTSDDTVEEVA